MRGELDDALARLQRWDEVRRQLSHEATGGSDPLLEEVVRAVTAVLHRHGSGTVTISVTDTGPTSTAEVSYRDGTVSVSSLPGATAANARPSRSAAKLAELIRQNPALLDGLRAGGDQPPR
jgi:hypothetical protein